MLMHWPADSAESTPIQQAVAHYAVAELAYVCCLMQAAGSFIKARSRNQWAALDMSMSVLVSRHRIIPRFC